MLLSVIIINYNTFQLTCDCIRSIKETAHLEHEIILVDNNSRECPPQKFLEVFPDLTLIALEENVGFGRANNRGVRAAKGKYVLLLNSDTLVQERTLDETVGYLEAHPQVDVLGCKVLFEDDRVQATVLKDDQQNRLVPALKYLIKRNTLFLETRLFIANRKRPEKSKSETPNSILLPENNTKKDIKPNHYEGNRIGSLIGVFLLLKRSVYEESKGFDPDFFMYYEEIEWFVNRLRRYNIVYYPHVAIRHCLGASNVYNAMNIQLYVSQHLFWYKMGRLQYAFYFLFQLLDVPCRLLVKVIYKRKRPSEEVPAIVRSFAYSPRILQYSNRYGSRRNMLKLRYLKKNNL